MQQLEQSERMRLQTLGLTRDIIDPSTWDLDPGIGILDPRPYLGRGDGVRYSATRCPVLTYGMVLIRAGAGVRRSSSASLARYRQRAH
eukprot:2032548-Rhodomonas_salina.1